MGNGVKVKVRVRIGVRVRIRRTGNEKKNEENTTKGKNVLIRFKIDKTKTKKTS